MTFEVHSLGGLIPGFVSGIVKEQPFFTLYSNLYCNLMFGINQIKTAALLGLLSGLIILVAYYLVGNESGLLIGLAIATFTTFGSWFYADQAALASYQARPLSREEDSELYDMVARLSEQAGIPTPKIFTVPTKAPNAFATGRDPDHATIAVTEGIRNLLSPEELEGVIAHELTHVRNRDTLIQAVAGTIGGAITFVGRLLTLGALYGPVGQGGRRGTNPIGLLFLIILAPLSAGLIQMAISRTREYAADAGAAEITHNPLALASALDKLETLSHQIPMHGNPAMAHLLIINPLSRKGLQSLFMTHPPTEDRIRRLAELAEQQTQGEAAVSAA
jgi:heat shock protein HtpX